MPSIWSCEGREFLSLSSRNMVERRLRNSRLLIGKESSDVSFSIWSNILLVQCVVWRVRRWECWSSSCSCWCALSALTSREGSLPSFTGGFLCGAAYLHIHGVTFPSSLRGEMDIFVGFCRFFGQTVSGVEVSYVRPALAPCTTCHFACPLSVLPRKYSAISLAIRGDHWVEVRVEAQGLDPPLSMFCRTPWSLNEVVWGGPLVVPFISHRGVQPFHVGTGQ